MALAFDASEKFGFDKPAGVACRYLDRDFRCSIHDRRDALGFGGCAGYDCLGAGNRVTQSVFSGASWRDRPELKSRMQNAFRAMRQVHRLLDLLVLAQKLPLNPSQAEERENLLAALEPVGGWSETSLSGFENGPVPDAVAHYLTRLDRAAEQMLARRAGGTGTVPAPHGSET